MPGRWRHGSCTTSTSTITAITCRARRRSARDSCRATRPGPSRCTISGPSRTAAPPARVSKAALDTAELQLKAAKAGHDVATAGAKQSSLSQGFTRVTAPYDGWVLQTLSEAGDLAVPGKPLMTLYAPLPLRAVVQVPASQADQVRTAQRIEVALPTPGGETTWLRPTQVVALPGADPVSQTVEWRLDLPDTAARPGQNVRVRLPAAV